MSILETIDQEYFLPGLNLTVSSQQTDDDQPYAQINALLLSPCNTSDPHLSCQPGPQNHNRSMLSVTEIFSLSPGIAALRANGLLHRPGK